MRRNNLIAHTKTKCKKADGRKPRVDLEKLSQACTERVVKLIRIIERRFPAFNEKDLADEKRDRCLKEVFLCDNSIALDKLPLAEYEKAWKKLGGFVITSPQRHSFSKS